MLLATLLATAGRRTGLDLLWRTGALALAAVALLLAWILRPRSDGSADALLAAALTTVAALLAGAALAGRLTPSRAPASLASARPSPVVLAVSAA